MKVQFEIYKENPTVTVNMTRDSVCAADDIDPPHEKSICLWSFTDPAQLIKELSTGYLPTVAGVGHTWDCVLNGIHIGAVHADKIVSIVAQVEYLKENHAHFTYHSAPY